jgi:tetratricopeptide (TPR) repeat protein
LTLLKEEVERIVGRKILTAADCNLLCNDIYLKTQSSTSLNTLRRLFDLMKSKYQPSLFTLDLLSKYCGYSSFSDFTNSKKNKPCNNENQDNSFVNFLVLLFRDFEVKSTNDITYIQLIHKIINNLEHWPAMIDTFQREIAKTASGQVFYYEQFINIDKLNSFYGKGLHYYLNEKKTVEAQLLGHSLLCLQSWLTMNDEGVENHYQEVLRHSVDENIHPFISARFFATQLYKCEISSNETEAILIQTREFYDNIRYSKFVHQNFPYFEYVLSEALVLTNQYEEALFYITEALKKRNYHVPPNVDLRLFESIYLFQAIALANIGKREKAKDILGSINTENFYFLSRHFNSILYLLQKGTFQKKEFLQKQVQYLVQQTGFKKLVVKQEECFKI